MSVEMGTDTNDANPVSNDRIMNHDVMRKVIEFRRIWNNKVYSIPVMHIANYSRVINQIKRIYDPPPQNVRNQLLAAKGKILRLEEQLIKERLTRQ